MRTTKHFTQEVHSHWECELQHDSEFVGKAEKIKIE